MPVAVTELPTRRQPILAREQPLTPEQAGAQHDDAVAASFRLARDDDQAVNVSNQLNSYKAVEDTLVGLGTPRASLRDPAWDDIVRSGNLPNYVNRLWWKVEAARAADPTHFADVPKSRPEFEVWAARRRGARDADEATAAKGSWLDRLAGSLGGGLLSMGDPENLIGIVGGGGSRTIAGLASREFLLNSNIAAVQAPNTAQSREAMGESYGAGEAVTDVLAQGAIGAGLAVGFHAVPKLFTGRKAAELPDAAVAEHFAANVPPEVRTPDEAAALHVINRQADIDAANPYHDTPDAHDLHAEKLRTAIARVMEAGPDGDAAFRAADQGTPAATMRAGPRGTTPPATPYTAPFDRAWSAIIGNEGGTDKSGRFLTSPAGAIGPAQVMPATAPHAAKLAGVPFDDHLYRTDHAYNDKLGRAYYADLLRQFDGDAEKAAAAYNAGPGSAKTGRGLRGAMARAERAGTPEAWRDFLPAETQKYIENFRRRTGGESVNGAPADLAAFDDPMAAQRQADLMAERPVDNAEVVDPMAVRPEVPQLRRDLFPDEASWRVAQDAQDAELRGDARDEVPAAESAPAPAPPAPIDPALLDQVAAIARGKDPLRVGPVAEALGIDQDVARRALALAAQNSENGLQVMRNGVVRRRPLAVEGKPVDALSFVARNGGILAPKRGDRQVGGWASLRHQSVARHDLIKGRGFPTRAGGTFLFRKDGMTIDEIGELLHEAGYFPPHMDRPTEADVLDLLENATQSKVYSIHDAEAVADKSRRVEYDQDRARAEDDVFNAADELGIVLDTNGQARAADKVLLEGVDHHAAVVEVVNEDIDDALANMAQEADDRLYEFDSPSPDRGSDQAGGAEGGPDGSARQSGDQGSGGGGTFERAGALEDEAQSLDPTPPDTAALSNFDDPDGAAAKAVGDSLEHDLKAALDKGAEIDPAVADRQRQEAALKTASPLQAKAEQDGTMGLSLFDQADAPVFDLGDGRLRSATDIFSEIDADEAAIKAARNCL